LILLDTNVVSEPMRARPEPRVLSWLDRQVPDRLWLRSVVVAELLSGLARLPSGARQRGLLDAANSLISEDFGLRVLPFDLEAATAYAALLAHREHLGRPITMADAQIAAVCQVHRAALASRITCDFEGADLELIDPWADV